MADGLIHTVQLTVRTNSGRIIDIESAIVRVLLESQTVTEVIQINVEREDK